jgi:Zn-dependent metalloprotease
LNQTQTSRYFSLIGCLVLIAGAVFESPVEAEPVVAKSTPHRQEATNRHQALALHRATGVAHLVRINAAGGAQQTVNTRSAGFDVLHEVRDLFGIKEPHLELEQTADRTGPLGRRHISYRQVYLGLPVFGGELRTHFGHDGSPRIVNGLFVPEISIDPVPRVPQSMAERIARTRVAKQHFVSDRRVLVVDSARLLVYREGLMRAQPGPDHLVWQVTVANGAAIREILFIDAHDATVVDQFSEIHTLNRAVDETDADNRVWSEGDPLPYSGSGELADARINQIITTAGKTYALFANLSAGSFLSWNGQDWVMLNLYEPEDPAVPCPNAWWDGRRTNFCAEFAVDDVIAHEWVHAYTQGTHGLSGGWQVGALNESFSDIFGEIIDWLGPSPWDSPDVRRSANECSIHGSSRPPSVDVSTPSRLAGTYMAGPNAQFNPAAPWSVTAKAELVDDGTSNPRLACEALVGFTAGRIALIRRGECLFTDKVRNAQAAGAVGAIIANHEGEQLVSMVGDGTLTIPAVFVRQSDGQLLEDAVGEGLEVTLSYDRATDDSIRWLVGEGVGDGIRDMWNPSCYGDPSTVSDPNYHCAVSDNGGVHVNAGVPNRAFALLVDGGDHEGMTVEGIGLVKAAHIYWRAMSVYQVSLTDFAMHADMVELSCQDLIGQPLPNLSDATTAGEPITLDDCRQVARAQLAVEARALPTQCDFPRLLKQGAPPVPGQQLVFSESFESDPGERWSAANEGVFDEYQSRNWVWTDQAPPGGIGGAVFATNSALIGDCTAGSDDQSGVMRLLSPPITSPGGRSLTLVFDHYVATEGGFDGGNLKISVNGGEFELIGPDSFLFNSYNDTLNDAVTGHNTNPMAGEQAFTGTDTGVSRGSWGQSQVDLSGLISAGDVFQLRFDFGVDGCNGAVGWYLDNVQVTTSSRTPRRARGRVGTGGR